MKKGGDEIHEKLTKTHKILEEHKSENDEAINTSKKKQLFLPPRPPYIPKIKDLSISYQSFRHIQGEGHSPNQKRKASAFYHLHPFGISKEKQKSTTKFNLLADYSKEGYLYIGLEKVTAPQELSLLFTLNESSGNRDKKAPRISWSYLDEQTWIPFQEQAVQDGTIGFYNQA